jgi:hypothetical protein
MHEQCKVGLGQIKTGSELLAIMTGKVKREAFILSTQRCSTGGARRMRRQGMIAGAGE